jgi:hypothetical protein
MAASVDHLEDVPALRLWQPARPTVPKDLDEVGILGKRRCKADAVPGNEVPGRCQLGKGHLLMAIASSNPSVGEASSPAVQFHRR